MQKYNNFYQDITALYSTISNLEFKFTDNGEELLDFKYVPHNLACNLCDIYDSKFTILDKSGIFRKSNNRIINRYETITHTLVVAFEPTILVTFNDDTTPASEVTINTNEFIILESNTSYYLGNGLVQIFYLKESDAI